MSLREGALALEARAHRRFEQLGDGLQLSPGLGVVHALPRVDQRALRRDQRRGGGIDVLWIRRRAARGV